jgi:hypothetical protein
MVFPAKDILAVWDECAASFTFPMLDNGYFYLAATRLSLFRSAQDWAMVIEVFGFSPRSGLPDTNIYSFASRLHDRNTADKYVSAEAYERYLRNNPHNEMRFAFPIEGGPWQEEPYSEFVAENASSLVIRGEPIPLPSPEELQRNGITPAYLPKVHVSELCRYLAAVEREKALATLQERRISIVPDMEQIMQLEEWHHPDLAAGEPPSATETFRQLADVLATGDTSLYRRSRPPNTDWRNWPDAGTL